MAEEESNKERFGADLKGLVMLGKVKSTKNEASEEELKLNAEQAAKLEEYYAACKAIDDEPEEAEPPDDLE
jgi:hypothetical protein